MTQSPTKLFTLLLALLLAVACSDGSTNGQLGSDATTNGDQQTPEDATTGGDTALADGNVTEDTKLAEDSNQQTQDTTIAEDLPPLPGKCLLLKEKIDQVGGYSYAASFFLDSEGQPWVVYSSNLGGFHGHLAQRTADGWKIEYDLFNAARMWIALEGDGTPAVLTENGGFKSSLFRKSGDAWNEFVVSAPENKKTALDALFLGGKKHLAIYTGQPQATLGLTDDTKTTFEPLPAHMSTLSPQLVASPTLARYALLFHGYPTGNVEQAGLYWYENSKLQLLGKDLGGVVAPLFDLPTGGNDLILARRMVDDDELVLLKRSDGKLPDVTLLRSEKPSESCTPETFEIGQSCFSEYWTHSQAKTGVQRDGESYFLYGRQRNHHIVSIEAGFIGCDPVDPTGPPPRCEGPPTEVRRDQPKDSELMLLTLDSSADPKTAKSIKLWWAELTIQHLRSLTDKNGVTHVLLVGAPTASGSGSGLYYFRFDLKACAD